MFEFAIHVHVSHDLKSKFIPCQCGFIKSKSTTSNFVTHLDFVTLRWFIRSVFFWGGGGGERPRSRCYGRTAALRLIVQHYDEDEEKDVNFFFTFPSNGSPVG
jgi:hypothetical protein